MATIAFGLGVALFGALLLAVGSELQSQAVHRHDSQWKRFIASPTWLAGLGLLTLAICTNFVALALAPISAVQSMSMVALAISAIVSTTTGHVHPTPRLTAGVVTCLVGVCGFIWTITSHPATTSIAHTDASLVTVVCIQGGVGVVGGLWLCLVHQRIDRDRAIAAMVLAATEFGSITAVFKVLVERVLTTGWKEALLNPVTLAVALSLAIGGLVATSLLQLAHGQLPSPTVVACLTCIDTITAAVLGTVVLRETSLTIPAALVAAACGALAITGVFFLRDLQRAPDPIVSPKPSMREDHSHAHRVL